MRCTFTNFIFPVNLVDKNDCLMGATFFVFKYNVETVTIQ